MADSSSNGTSNKTYICFNSSYKSGIGSIVFLTVLIGLPVITKMLWTAFQSKKTDVLNVNYAVFHSFQYLLSGLQLLFLLLHMEKEFVFLGKFLFVYVLIGGPMTLSFICLERYIAVIYPTSYPQLKTRRCREVWALSVWLVALPTATISGLSMHVHDLHRSAIDVVTYSVFFGMVVVIVYANIGILRVLKKSGPATDKLHPAKKRAIQIIRGISIIVLLCYVPVGVLNQCKSIMEKKLSDVSCLMAPVCVFLVSVASLVHLMSYLSTTGRLFSCQRLTN